MCQADRHALLITYAGVLKLIGSITLLPSLRLFSLGAICGPLIGFFSGTLGCFLVYVVRTALSFSGIGSVFIHLPTCAGSIALSSPPYTTRIIACFALITFLAHPIGRASYLYCSYWLIPLGISFMPAPSIFLRSLMSTFITHAVGSVVFIYTHETTSHFWLELIPQVWVERISLSLLFTACYYAVTLSINLIQQYRVESRSCQNH
jgi:hypothetical protein